MADEINPTPEDETQLPGEDDLTGSAPDEEGEEEEPEQREEEEPEQREEEERQQPERKKTPREKKSLPERVKEAKKKVERARKTTERIKKTAKKTAEEIRKTPERVRRGVETARKTTQTVSRTAQQAAQQASRAAQASARAAQVAAQTAIRATQIAIQVAIRAVQIAIQVAVQATKISVQVATGAVKVVVFLVSNPVGWIILGVILVFLIIMGVFMCGWNLSLSEAGGSVKEKLVSSEVKRDPVDGSVIEVTNDLIARIQEKVTDGSLVIYTIGAQDLTTWECGGSGGCVHLLDARLLKTIDYLTSLHDYLEIGLLQTNSPSRSRYTLLKELAAYSEDGEEKKEVIEAKTAFVEGQAMAILAVDKSKISAVLDQPILISWQRTLLEADIRPLWEEMAYAVGLLDKNIPKHRALTEGKDREALKQVVQSATNKAAYLKMFQIINRVVELINRAQGIAKLDSRTVDYWSQALNIFTSLKDKIGDDPASLSDDEIADVILGLGTPEKIDDLRAGIRLVYKATQVANMVGWDSGGSDLSKAYEARNKIRLVIKELLEMPTKVSLYGTPQIFDKDMVVKQIIVYSPEDDLDNGLERLDIFPFGMTSVGVGGVGFDDSAKDGVNNYYDDHFSHAPIDNGVFSKMGINFIYTSEDLGVEETDLGIYQTEILGQLEELWNIFVGAAGDIDNTKEVAKRATYQDFIQVGF